MKLAKAVLPNHELHVVVVDDNAVRVLNMTEVEECRRLSDILNAPDPAGLANFLIDKNIAPVAVDAVKFLAPVDHQEVWAAGVTYKRSQVARMEESESGADHYDKVYSADRPELFFKSTPARVVHPDEPVRIRQDARWSVPEPELALMINPDMKIAGYTIGNDMSSRDIEGENPLYLPQAKVYNQSCSLGPVVRLANEPLIPDETTISVSIRRGSEEVFHDETNVGQLNRKLEDLADWLGRELDFPDGAVLLTGTGVIPPDDFTLNPDDVVTIEIAGIGSLSNHVVCG